MIRGPLRGSGRPGGGQGAGRGSGGEEGVNGDLFLTHVGRIVLCERGREERRESGSGEKDSFVRGREGERERISSGKKNVWMELDILFWVNICYYL